MIVKKFRRQLPVVFAIALVLLSVACKKSKNVVPDTGTGTVPPITTPTATRAELTKDSLYLYAREVYLWSDAIPSYDVFNPRKFTGGSTELANYNSELFAISQLKANPLTSKAFEYNTATPSSPKYSYIFDIANQNPTAFVFDPKSSVDLEGNGNDLGVKAATTTKDVPTGQYTIFLTAVYPGSPAALAGLTRGTVLTSINGQSIGSIANSSTELAVANNALFSSNSATLSGRRKDGTTFTNLILNKAVYTSSPILKETVIVDGSKKIGYIAFARFSSTANAQNVLLAAFNKFAAANITNLVVDLRYNGGGYVSTAEYFANLIAPASLTGKVMYREYYNSLMQSNQAKILANQPLLDASNKVQYQNGKMVTYANVDYSVSANTNNFAKKGSLEGLSNVVFIVSGSTASASELLINSLRPYMTVKLVGTTTYGKPVGFFPIRLENKYDVYYSMFQTQNSLGEGEYFAGFTPDAIDTYDDGYKDFGDPEENYLKKAIGYIKTNVFSVSSNKIPTIAGAAAGTINVPMGENSDFKGMIENRFKLRQ